MEVNIIWELYIFIIAIFNLEVKGQNLVKPSSSSHNPLDQTELPEEDVQFAIDEHFGRYTTNDFYYFNHQFGDYKDHERCYEQYMKCLLSQVVVLPVCVITRGDYKFDQVSYCDVFHLNCIYKWRRYRILSYGKCYQDQRIEPSFRRVLNRLSNKIIGWFW